MTKNWAVTRERGVWVAWVWQGGWNLHSEHQTIVAAVEALSADRLV